MAEWEGLAAKPATAAHAWQLLRLLRPELALEVADALVAQQPLALSPHLIRTEALRQMGRLPEAAVAAKTAITLAPQSATAFLAFAQVRGQQGELDRAEKLIKEALRLDPTNADYYSFLAQLQYLQQQLSEAIATAAAGLRTSAQHAECLLWRALALEASEQSEAANADLAQALRLAPDNPLIQEWQGYLLLKRYEPHTAGQHLAEALRLAPHSTRALLLLRQARQQQLWPCWLLHQHQRLRHDWRDGRPFSWRTLVVGPCTPFYAGRSWYLTRHQALFQQKIPGQRRALLRRWATIAATVALPVGFLYAFITYELPPYTLVFMLVALLRGFIAKSKQ
jgi:tetratricopeptide (TPR) repeat protein